MPFGRAATRPNPMRARKRVLMKGQQEHVIARFDRLPTHAAAAG